MQITHLGHACLLVETGGARILVDPGNFSTGLGTVTGLDAIVMTHQHPDHADTQQLPALVTANRGALVLAELQTAEAVAEATNDKVRPEPLSTGQRLEVHGASLDLVGELHAFNHSGTPQVGNLGVVVKAEGEPTLFHPGDAYDADPGPVDILALPLSAPWTPVRDTLDFVRRIAPRIAVPIHDALLSEAGRAMYIGHVQNFGGEGLEVADLSDGKPREL
jgi:L-ascorbate metabolism protein UlaG (beta-lactamase superfamily)